MSFGLSDILEWTRGRLANSNELGARAEAIRVSRPASRLGSSKSDEIAFFFSREFQAEVPGSHAGILITAEPFVVPLKSSGLPLWKESAVIACPDPYFAMALITEKFAAEKLRAEQAALKEAKALIHPTAIVDPSAELGESVRIGPNVVVEGRVKIGARSILEAATYVSAGCSIGVDCHLFPKVTVYSGTRMGDRVRIHAGAVIGADGFGYAPIRESGAVIGHQKIYHFGGVSLGNDVEIGANSCVDRGTFDDTVLEDFVKLDNLVQIGHNAKLAKGAVVCGVAALAGGTQLGKIAYVGALTGIANKAKIGDGAQVAACSLVFRDVPPGGTAVGNPQRESREHFRVHAWLNKSALRKTKETSKGD